MTFNQMVEGSIPSPLTNKINGLSINFPEHIENAVVRKKSDVRLVYADHRAFLAAIASASSSRITVDRSGASRRDAEMAVISSTSPFGNRILIA